MPAQCRLDLGRRRGSVDLRCAPLLSVRREGHLAGVGGDVLTRDLRRVAAVGERPDVGDVLGDEYPACSLGDVEDLLVSRAPQMRHVGILQRDEIVAAMPEGLGDHTAA